jgi:hypothetical protein
MALPKYFISVGLRAQILLKRAHPNFRQSLLHASPPLGTHPRNFCLFSSRSNPRDMFYPTDNCTFSGTSISPRHNATRREGFYIPHFRFPRKKRKHIYIIGMIWSTRKTCSRSGQAELVRNLNRHHIQSCDRNKASEYQGLSLRSCVTMKLLSFNFWDNLHWIFRNGRAQGKKDAFLTEILESLKLH